MKTMILLLIFWSSVSSANQKASDACQIKSNLRLIHQVTNSNIANLQTTRTPEGGPYRRKSVVCENQNCKLIESQDVVLEYEPTHPDANSNGYVSYPYINIDQEIAIMKKNALKYKAIVALCP